MTIKEAEALSGVSSRNIRFYEKKGLLSPARNRENDYREYSEADIQQLKLIRALRMVDMPIEQIRSVCDGEAAVDVTLAAHRKILSERKQRLETAIRFCDEYIKTPDQDLDELLLRMDAAVEERELFTDWCRDYLQNVKRNILLVLIGLMPSAVGMLLLNMTWFLAYRFPGILCITATACLGCWFFIGFWLTKKWNQPYRNVLISHCTIMVSAVIKLISCFDPVALPQILRNLAWNLIIVPISSVLIPVIGCDGWHNVTPLIKVSPEVMPLLQVLLMALVFYLGGITAKLLQFSRKKQTVISA